MTFLILLKYWTEKPAMLWIKLISASALQFFYYLFRLYKPFNIIVPWFIHFVNVNSAEYCSKVDFRAVLVQIVCFRSTQSRIRKGQGHSSLFHGTNFKSLKFNLKLYPLNVNHKNRYFFLLQRNLCSKNCSKILNFFLFNKQTRKLRQIGFAKRLFLKFLKLKQLLFKNEIK